MRLTRAAEVGIGWSDARGRRRIGATLSAMAIIITGVGVTAPAAQGDDLGLVAHYPLGETTGAVATDASGGGRHGSFVGSPQLSGGEGVRLDGVDDHVRLPDDLLAGLESLTVSAEVLIRPEQSTPYFIYGFGNTDAGGAGDGYLFATGNSLRASIATGNWATEQTVDAGSAMPRGTWKTLTYTLDDGTDTARLYLDGVQVAESAGVTTTPGQIGGGSTTANYIGRSVYTADRHLAGSVRDVRIYDTALAAAQVAALHPSDAVRVQRDAAALDLGDLSAVSADIVLPATGPNGAAVSWVTGDGAVISQKGAVTRPSAGGQPVEVTLTATISRGSEQPLRREFVARVMPLPGQNALAQEDLDALSIPNAHDIRGNVTLPAIGPRHGSPIAWSTGDADVITASADDGRAPGVVTRPGRDTTVTLVASVAGTGLTRAFELTVKASPRDLDRDYTAGYLWTHFAAEGGYEKIFLGHSPDGLHWSKLNDNEPVLANLGGDLGVRDPHLVRSAEGDRYWIIGTDLHAEGGGPGGSGWDQLNASQNLVVWESTDLVNWSDQRIVFAGFPHAGNVWAPEAIYNEGTGEYYVYWSARDRRDDGSEDWALRVYLTKTRDFVTFTEPEIWASMNERGDGLGGPNIIDSSIAEEDGVYYRFSTSDWHTVVDTAPSLDGPWTRVIDRGEAAAHGLKERMEGITAYRLPGGRWAIMGDDGGYYGHVADTLASLQFRRLEVGPGADEYSFEQRFRHGSVLRLSAAEEARVLAAYGDRPDPDEPERGLIAEYTFDDGTLDDTVGSADLDARGSAAVVADAERGNVLRMDGTAGGYAAFPVGFFDGRDRMTISMDVKSDLGSGNFFTFAFGADAQRYYFLRVRGGEVRSAITRDAWQNESAVEGAVPAGEWTRVDIVFDDASMAVYADGLPLGRNDALDAGVSQLGSGLVGYLGRSLYAADGYFRGSFDNVRIHDRPLSAAEILAAAGATDQLLDVSLADADALAFAPIVDSRAHSVMLPVRQGTDVSALAPVFTTAVGATVTPASGATVDLSTPVSYTLTQPSGAQTTWWMEARVVRSPVIDGLYADPNIAVFGDTYYIYATSDGYPGWGGKDFYVWKSTDLVEWERGADPILTLDQDSGQVPWAVGNAWAPTIIERDGRFYFYFSGHNPAYDRKTLGVAVADSPEGPFVAAPTPMIVNDESIRSGQAIDPAAFRDPVTGTYYLGWGNGGPADGPVLAELSDDMMSVEPGSLRRIAGLTGFREALFFNYREGLYHLTYSIDDTGSPDYRVGYATATSMDGPWTYRGVILEKDLSLGIKGTGHSSIINVPGTDDWYIAYHRFAIPDGGGTRRETTIDRLEFGADGLIKPVVPTLESVEPHSVPPMAGAALAVSTSVRCVVGKAQLIVTVVNTGTVALDVALTTPFGARQIAAVPPGDTASLAVASRTAQVAGGAVEASAVAPDGAHAVATATYPARGCG